MYAGSLAAVTADTWGTEVGILFRGRPVDIRTFHRVEPGTSGGVSLPGMVGAISGALVIAVSSYPLLDYADILRGMELVIIAGLIGSLSDSFFGSTVQIQYKCCSCGKITERKIHCDAPATYLRGFRWITNDVVNLVCAVAGAGSAAAMLLQ